MKKDLHTAFLTFIALFTSSSAFAQFNWVNWSYPTSHTATASVGGGTITLTASGTNNVAVDTTDIPIQYQPSFPYAQIAGDTAAAQSANSSNFEMELDFNGFMTTAGLTLAIGNVADYFFSGYTLTAFNAANQPISLTTFSPPEEPARSLCRRHQSPAVALICQDGDLYCYLPSKSLVAFLDVDILEDVDNILANCLSGSITTQWLRMPAPSSTMTTGVERERWIRRDCPPGRDEFPGMAPSLSPYNLKARTGTQTSAI